VSLRVKSRENIKQSKLPHDVRELYPLFNNASFIISRTRELELANFRLTQEKAVLLHNLIKMGGSATLSDIAARTFRQYHSVSTLVSRMAKSGLVKKVKNSGKKKFQVSITDKGFKTYSQATCNSLDMIFSVLSLKEQKTLAKYLQRLSDRARNLLGLDYKHPFLP
jgi:DNA-binding MarR family transcriptional regulator